MREWNENALVLSNPFKLQITASVCKRPLRATWATIAAPTLPAVAVREPMLLFVTEGALQMTQTKKWELKSSDSLLSISPRDNLIKKNDKVVYFFPITLKK